MKSTQEIISPQRCIRVREACDFPYTFPNHVVTLANRKVKAGNIVEGPEDMSPTIAWGLSSRDIIQSNFELEWVFDYLPKE